MIEKLKEFFKKSQVWGFFVSVAVMATISLVYFAPDNLAGNTLQQSDMQQGLANGHEAQQYQEQTGEKALWTNSLFSGMPTFQISPSYESNRLFSWINRAYGLWLPSPSNLLFMLMFGFLIMLYCLRMRWYYALIGAVAWGFSSYFMILIGAGHIWKLLALTYVPPTIGGLVLCYRGRYLAGAALTSVMAMMQLAANHPQMSYYFAFVMVGMAIGYLVILWREKKVRQWLTASAVVIGAGLLAFGANLPSIYNTYEYAKETKRSQSELTAQPAADPTEAAERPTGGLPYGDIVNWSYGRSEMFSLLIPNIKGGATVRPEKGSHTLMSLDKLDSAKDAPYQAQHYLQYFTQYFNDSEGTNGPVYVGALICALFLLGCIIVRGPMKWVMVVLTVLSMLLALGRNFAALTDMMIYYFPMYNKFRAVESILVIAQFTMPLLGMMALAQYLGGPKALGAESEQGSLLTQLDNAKAENYERPLLISFGICALLCLVGVIAPGIYGDAITSHDKEIFSQLMSQDPTLTYQLKEAVESLRLGMVRHDALISLIYILIGGTALFLYKRGMAKRAVVIAVVGVVVAVDLYATDRRYVNSDCFIETNNPFAKAIDPFEPDGIDQFILQDTDPNFRVMDIPAFVSPTRSYHHKMIGGYHAAKLNRYEDLIQNRMLYVQHVGYHPELRIDSIRSQYPAEQQPLIDELLADYHVLDMLNARYVITGDRNNPLIYNDNALGNAWLVDGIRYVENADQEMAALGTLYPAHQAVADRRFMDVLGGDVVAPQPGDEIRLVSYTPNQLVYDYTTTANAIGVFSEVYFPWGWKATIDDKPAQLGRVNYILRAMRLPAGSHQVVMTFDPDSIHTTTAVAYASVTMIYLLCLLAMFAAYISRRKE